VAKAAEDDKGPSTPSKGATPKKVSSRFVKPLNKTPGKVCGDRFIPNRDATDFQSAQYQLSRPKPVSLGNPNEKPPSGYLDEAALAYQEEVAKACGIDINKRILAFKMKPPSNDKAEPLRSIWRKPRAAQTASLRRRISTIPERVLDAPGLADDYYLNLLDWSTENLLAVALEDTVYTWNASTGSVSDFCRACTDDSTTISSVQFTNDGSHLAIGTGDGNTQIWDVEAGSKHDVRIASHKIGELIGHTGEVCGLKWRADGQLLASGGNDNLVNIWDARSSTPKITKAEHKSAVKALAWCPWQLNLLATGGGSHDKSIHFWNTTTSAKLSSIDAGSQVTSILWSRDYKELLTTHGFPDNQLTIWSYPSMNRVIDIPGHESRVLYSAISPDGQTVVTGASDENLKFWKVFERKKGERSATSAGSLPGYNKKGDVDLDDLINLPIEVVYNGKDDLPESSMHELTKLPNVKTVDLASFMNTSVIRGWAIKPFAMLVSSFQEVILMDADTFFFKDPAVLFDFNGYKQNGTLLFRDRTVNGRKREHQMWINRVIPNLSAYAEATNRLVKGTSLHECDSGVVVINRSRASNYYALLMTTVMNLEANRGEVWKEFYGQGDKETWWIAHELMTTPYHIAHGGGSAVGFTLTESEKQYVCGGLLHVDERWKPLWFNGGLIANKHYDVGKKTTLNFTHWMIDPDYKDVEWLWEEKDRPFCLRESATRPIEKLSERDLKTASFLYAAWKEALHIPFR
ncbi:ubiquitin-protein transferase activating protein, partial [Phlyctochytrium bullatum]